MVLEKGRVFASQECVCTRQAGTITSAHPGASLRSAAQRRAAPIQAARPLVVWLFNFFFSLLSLFFFFPSSLSLPSRLTCAVLVQCELSSVIQSGGAAPGSRAAAGLPPPSSSSSSSSFFFFSSSSSHCHNNRAQPLRPRYRRGRSAPLSTAPRPAG